MDCSTVAVADCAVCPATRECQAWEILEQGVNVDTVREKEVDDANPAQG
jgi:hypothetical protein